MDLSEEEISILNGEKGETLAKVMKTIVMYGDTFGADRLVPVNGEYGHLVTSFGLSMMKPVYKLMDELISAGICSSQKFTVDPRPIDKDNVPAGLIKNLVFNYMYSKQDDYEKQLKKMGLLSEDGFTCTCYIKELGNRPGKGEIISWAESSAVVYANSVLGARCNRNSGLIELFGSILGKVPNFGLLTDEGRKATWIIEVQTNKLPEAQVLGSVIGMKVMEEVPYIKGLDQHLGNSLNAQVKDYLKDMGAATASNGAVGLYHVEGITPEAIELGESLIQENAKTYVIDELELDFVKKNYPVMWKDSSARPQLCFIGCPHLSIQQLETWVNAIESNLSIHKNDRVTIPTVLTTSPSVLKKFKESPLFSKLEKMGISLSYICPLMYMNNPLCSKMPVITNSNKLRTYTTARYYTDVEILDQITRRR